MFYSKHNALTAMYTQSHSNASQSHELIKYNTHLYTHIHVPNMFKFMFHSKLINSVKYILRYKNTYVITNVSYGSICVEFERKYDTTLVSLVLNCPQILNYVMTDPLNLYI